MSTPSTQSQKLSVTIARRQHVRLNEEAERLQLSISELLRRMIDEHFDRKEQPK